MKTIKKYWVGIFIIIVGIIFSYPFFIQQNFPIPSDTIIGLYHPFRDFYAKDYPNGIPFKNFLITDPVRQQYPWKNLVIEQFGKGQMPLWNPYNFSGTPLLANIQSAPFYPGNILFFLLPFVYAWSILIIVQPVFAALGMYLYLRNLKLQVSAAVFGSISFAFSGFFVAWFEWGTILHVALWMPYVLYSIDKIFDASVEKKRTIGFACLLLVSLCSSFFAGHIQTFFYLGLLAITYVCARVYQTKNIRALTPLVIVSGAFLLITWIQWFPTLQLILASGRDLDQADWTKPGWFIPLQHSIQFVIPDFFGNPATLNYWSEWNYAEFVGYIGIAPFLMALYALMSRRDKKTLFFGITLLVSCLFAYATPIAKLPYVLSIPFLSTTQPTRLLFVIDFSLAVLAAFGLDYFLKEKKKIFYPILFIFLIILVSWAFVFVGKNIFSLVTSENILITKRNIYLPTILFFLTSIVGFGSWYFPRKKYSVAIISMLVIAITLFDLFRFSMKFNPYTPQQYLYPQTRTIDFLQKDKTLYRIMTTESQILPPNFSSMYHLQSVDGYDPIYLKRYGELIAASERGKADITPPFGFNRIITPHNYNSRIMDLLNVKYILSISDIHSPKVEKVFQEGQTRVYKNKNVYPRVFFVSKVIKKQSTQEVFEALFDKAINLEKTAVINDKLFRRNTSDFTIGGAKIITYTDNEITIETTNQGEGFLVITNIFYPLWKAKIGNLNNTNKENVGILKADYALQGVIVPKGKHIITLYTSLL